MKSKILTNIKTLTVPLTADLLLHCIQTLHSVYLCSFIDPSLKSMSLLALFGFSRCSEFIATSTYNPSRCACLSDIRIHSPDTLIFNLTQSKTGQLCLSHPIFSIPPKFISKSFQTHPKQTDRESQTTPSKFSADDQLKLTTATSTATSTTWKACSYLVIWS